MPVKISIKCIILSLKIVLIQQTVQTLFCHCLPKYLFTSIQNPERKIRVNFEHCMVVVVGCTQHPKSLLVEVFDGCLLNITLIVLFVSLFAVNK